jgi:nucleotide-binding universal stress UspA family protein
MRVLVALDGSPASDLARSLVGSLPWTDQDVLRFVTVLDDGVTLFGSGWAELAVKDPEQLEARLQEASRAVVARAAASVEPNVAARVECEVLAGRPASTIVADATAFGADLVILGTRGLGPFQRAMLGSVSAEVVDHAPCPVLVARRSTLARTLVADDGSEAAAVARRIVAGPPFAGLPVHIVSVAQVSPPWQAAVSPIATGPALEVWDEALRVQREDHERIGATAAAELAGTGGSVDVEVRVGDPAGEIVAAATEWNADLVALGTHGRTGIQRLLLGSVARNVLQHAPCSVLVARAPKAAAAEASGDGGSA